MFKKLLIIFCLSLFAIAAITGCSVNNQAGTGSTNDAQPGKIMADFEELIGKEPGVEEVAGFITGNIGKVSKNEASEMVRQFEKVQKTNLPRYEEMFFNDQLQSKINAEYQAIITKSEIKDTQVRELVTKTLSSGYKIETAEGTYFPIIDYEFYKQFSPYVTEDMKDYIAIMAVESSRVPAKDAALVIEWSEIVRRALAQEKFINTHKDSVKVEDVKLLYKKYSTFIFYGANNTPLFSYESNTMNPEAKEVYINAVKNAKDSRILKAMEEFLNLVKNNNYKLTGEAEKFRDDFIQRI